MNKPIAWTIDELNTDNWGDTDWQITVTKEKWSDRQIPLYTHPAKILNKEEILKLAEEFDIWLGDDDIEFIQFKRWLENLYKEGTLQLDYKSCEMMSQDLYDSISQKYPNREVWIEVSEDGENGSFIKY